MNGKSILTSKTFWLNILGLAVTLAGFLPPEQAAVIIPIANILIRFLTNKPITGLITSK